MAAVGCTVSSSCILGARPRAGLRRRRTAPRTASSAGSGSGAGRREAARPPGPRSPGRHPGRPGTDVDRPPLTVTLKPRDPAALAAEVQAVSDPSSPEYRHFLTPTRVRPAIRADAGHHRAGHAPSLRQEGLTVGTPVGHRPVAARVGHGRPGAVRLLDADLASTACRRARPATTTRRRPRWTARWRPRSKGILGLDTLSPPQPSTSVPEASQAAAARPRPTSAAPTLAPGQPTPDGIQLQQQPSASRRRRLTGALDAPELAQAYGFDPLYSSNDYGAGSTVALLEMSGAGLLAERHQHLRQLLRHHARATGRSRR